MALIPLREYVKDNPYNFCLSTLKSLAKKPGGDSFMKRLSSRIIMVDTEALEEWISTQRYYTCKRSKKAKT